MTKKSKAQSTLPSFYLKKTKSKPEKETSPSFVRHPSLNDPDWYFMNAALQKSEFKNYSATKDSLMDLPSNASIVENQNQANPRYNLSLGGYSANSLTKIQTAKKCCLNATKPYKILDAPNLKANPIYNVFGWNSNDCLILGLGDKAYTWDNNTEQVSEVYSSTSNTNYITACSWIRGASHFGIGLNTGQVEIISCEKQRKIRSFFDSESPICKIHYYNPQKTVITGNERGNVSFHDLREKDSLKFGYNIHKGAVCHIESEPSNYLVATAGDDNNIVLTDLRKGNYNDEEIIGTDGSVTVLKFSRLSQKTLFYCDTKNFSRHVIFNNKITKRAIEEPVVDLLFHKMKNEDYYSEIVAVCKDRFISYEYNSMKKVKIVETESENKIIKSEQNIKSGNVLVSTSDDEKIRLWKIFDDSIENESNTRQDLMRNIRI